MTVKLNKTKLLLFFIILLGFFVRFYKLNDFPVGFHLDEAQVGYNAYSLLKTGRDEFGNFLPHHLNIFGYSRPTALFYLTIPSIAIFGLNEFATRLPTAILGSLSVLVFYFLVKEVFSFLSPRSDLQQVGPARIRLWTFDFGLITALLLAISPWHIIFSRATTENVLELLTVILAIYFLFYGARRKKQWSFLISYLFFILSYFSYLSSRVFVPLLLIGFGTIFFRDLRKKKILRTFLIVLILYLIFPFGTFLLKSDSISRFRQIGLFSNPGVQLEIDEQIREDGQLNPLITRVFHNKVLNYSLKFLENYQEYFTGKFLFTSGGFPMRFRVPQMGVLYFFECLPLFLGLVSLLRKKRKGYVFVFYWLIIGPMAAAVTIEDIPNFQRALLTLPPLLIIISLGVKEIYLFFQKKHLSILGIALIISFYVYGLSFFLHQYFVHQLVHRPWYRMVEMKEMVSEVDKIEGRYEKIMMTKNSTEPYIYFLFYQKIEPEEWHKAADKLDWKGSWHWKNYYFIRDDCPLAVKEVEKKEDNLYIEKGECLEAEWKKTIKEIRRPDNSLALRLVEIDTRRLDLVRGPTSQDSHE